MPALAGFYGAYQVVVVDPGIANSHHMSGNVPSLENKQGRA